MAGAAQWRRAINDLAAQYGGTVELTGGGHLRIVLPNRRSVFCSATPSDGRALRNTVALVRREAAKTCANGQR